MPKPFEPVGTEARWRTVYGLFRAGNVGDIVTYEAMGAALDLNAEHDRQTIRGAIGRAAKEFEEVDSHAVAPIRNVGYRIVAASEHMGLAKIHQRKSSRALVRGKSKVVHVDWNALTPQEQQAFGMVGQMLAAQMDYMRRLDIRTKNHEQAIKSIAVRTERSEEEVAELRARLEKLEVAS